MYISKKTLDKCSSNYRELSKKFLEKFLDENADSVSCEIATGLMVSNPMFMEGFIMGLLLADQQMIEDLENMVKGN